MIRITLPYLYDLAATLKQLTTLRDGMSLTDARYVLYNAQSQLEGFLYGSVYSESLRATAQPGAELLQAVKKISASTDKDKKLDFIDVWSVNNTLTQFETVLTAEMNITPAFFVTKKRGYDIVDLIDRAEILLPKDFPTKVPEAVNDIRQAGKCLAFEIPTAAGFHMMRALELTLRLYYDVSTKNAARPNTNNMGDYLRDLEQKKCGNEKVIAILRQIKDLHRNELIHPEITLTLDEALTLWGIVQSAIAAMLPFLKEDLRLTSNTQS